MASEEANLAVSTAPVFQPSYQLAQPWLVPGLSTPISKESTERTPLIERNEGEKSLGSTCLMVTAHAFALSIHVSSCSKPESSPTRVFA